MCTTNLRKSVWGVGYGLLAVFASQSASGQTIDLPVGTVVSWLKDYANTPSLPAGWLACNGQVVSDSSSPYDGQMLPDLNNQKRFLRGSASSGVTGGSETHRHQLGEHTPNGISYIDGGEFDEYTDVQSSLPSFYEVVWIIKVKSLPGGVPAVSTWGLIIFGILVLTVGSVLVARRRVATAR
jgi:hypothetical protein